MTDDDSGQISLAVNLIGAALGDDFTARVFLDEKITRTTNLNLNIHCILFFHHPIGCHPSEWHDIDGLLLEPTKNRIFNGSKRTLEGEFTRFGRLQGTGRRWDNFVQGEPRIIDPGLEFEKDNGDGTYTITVV